MDRRNIVERYIRADIEKRVEIILDNYGMFNRMMTINALACADSVLIPVQASYLPVKGLEQLMKTIQRVQKRLNKKLVIEGILLTMVDSRLNYAKDISQLVIDSYSNKVPVFESLSFLL